MDLSELQTEAENPKEDFNRFFQIRKKIKALENLSEARNLKFPGLFEHIKIEAVEGILGEELKRLDDLLDEVLYHEEIEYRRWCHKTSSLKREIQTMLLRNKTVRPSQLQLPLF